MIPRGDKRPQLRHLVFNLAILSAFFISFSARAQDQQQSKIPAQLKTQMQTEQPERLIEAVVATINQAVITKGEVEAEARVVLLRRGGLAGLQRPIDDGLRASVLQYLINQEVILAEAHRLQLFQVPEQDLDNKLKELVGLFSDSASYHRFLNDNGLSESDLKQILRRDLRVGRFLDGRVRMLSEIDLDELRAFYLQHRKEYEGEDFAQARDAISARLGRQRSAKAIAHWVDELRAQAHIKILRPYQKAKTKNEQKAHERDANK